MLVFFTGNITVSAHEAVDLFERETSEMREAVGVNDDEGLLHEGHFESMCKAKNIDFLVHLHSVLLVASELFS